MNFYNILKIPYTANLLTICEAYQNKCQKNPQNIFLYTKAFNILTNKTQRLIYDANLLKVNITTLIKLPLYEEYLHIDEYELIPFISWLEIFSDYLYDCKYFTTNQNYQNLIDTNYKLLKFLSHLKNHD